MLVLLVFAMLCMAGCSTVISNQSLALVDRRITFAELRKNPDVYAGKHLLLGGGIAGVRNTSAGGELEVVQFATDESGEITSMAASGGRFLVSSPGFLDPALYRIGLLVTVVGKVQGSKTMWLAGVEYTYPVLTIQELHLWQPEEMSPPPSFHFGLGVGTVIH
ncbi:MAG TPA: Slp family lipoprotein [Geobacteraceae bacterium]|nr:Slp family lipoprotein [Geobacteraceae bacterium]